MSGKIGQVLGQVATIGLLDRDCYRTMQRYAATAVE